MAAVKLELSAVRRLPASPIAAVAPALLKLRGWALLPRHGPLTRLATLAVGSLSVALDIMDAKACVFAYIKGVHAMSQNRHMVSQGRFTHPHLSTQFIYAQPNLLYYALSTLTDFAHNYKFIRELHNKVQVGSCLLFNGTGGGLV